MKTCCACIEEFSLDAFGKNSKSSDGLQSRCKQCKRDYDNKYYNQKVDKKRKRKISRDRTSSISKRYKSLKRKLECSKCGYNKCLFALQFHHNNDDKLMNVSNMVTKGYSQEKIIIEMNKCEILCANCHAEETFN